MNPKLKRFIETIGDLPAMPSVAAKVIETVENANASADQLREIIEQDPALAVRILKVANSPLYGFSRDIQTLTHAIALLGFKAVSSAVLAASLKTVFRQFKLADQRLWAHATACGAAASQIARYEKVAIEPEEAFVAGLLHDLGKIALRNTARESYDTVLSRVEEDGVSFVEAEREVFGFDHAELGGHVVARWNLSDRLEQVVRCHHDLAQAQALEPGTMRLCALVAVTTRCATRLGVGRSRSIPEADPRACPGWSALELGDEDLDPILEIVSTQAESVGRLEA